MIQLEHIKATAHPLGHRVDIRWLNPDPLNYGGVKVVGRKNTHPVSTQDGHLVKEIANSVLFTLDLSYSHHLDGKIVSETLSYKFLNHQQMVTTAAKVTVKEPGNLWKITEGENAYMVARSSNQLQFYGYTEVSDTGLWDGRVYYYTLFPYKGQPKQYEFNRKNRISTMTSGSADFSQRMYEMLPVIYHRYDTRLPQKSLADGAGMSEEDRKRGQLRRFMDIPGTHLDQFYTQAKKITDLHDIQEVDGNLLPLLGQWIGWDTYFSKEISEQRNELRNATQVFQTVGQIPTLETMIRLITGWENRSREMVNNLFLTNRPEELNTWLAHRDSTGKWQEPEEVFSLDMAFEGRPAAVRDENKVLWLFYHTRRNGKWDIWYKTFHENQDWAPSQPIVEGETVDTHPTAVLRNKTLMLFWNSFNPANQSWSIKYRELTAGQWSEIRTFDHGISIAGTERKSPAAVVDHNKKAWLFWQERVGGHGNPWKLKINRYNGTQWELTTAEDFPDDAGKDPRVEKDLFLAFRSTGTGQSICAFWARKHQSGGNRSGWETAYREKTDLTDIDGNWGSVLVVPKVQKDYTYHDCEPAAIVDKKGDIEFFWSSNRTGTWTVYHRKMTDMTTIDITAETPELTGDYSKRTPTPFWSGNNIYLVYRSNQGITYQGGAFRETNQKNFRRAGCVSMDFRNKPTIKRIGKFNDILTYTYDSGQDGNPNEETWFGSDTIGIYLDTGSDSKVLIEQKMETLKSVMGRFLPIQLRPVYILE